MCVRFVDSLWVVCEVPKVWWNTCHTLGTYRHTLGCSAELPKVLLEHTFSLLTLHSIQGVIRVYCEFVSLQYMIG